MISISNEWEREGAGMGEGGVVLIGKFCAINSKHSRRFFFVKLGAPGRKLSSLSLREIKYHKQLLPHK